jgi:hypothetical protein
MMPGGIVAHRRRRPRPGARPRARAVALDWGIFSQHIRGEFTQQLQSVPVRTFADWGDPAPGYFEADLVSHTPPIRHPNIRGGGYYH